LWNGTANSAVDLAPAGFTNSTAYGTDGVHQVGSANGPTTGNLDHAMLWSGTAASAIDLNPTNLSGFVKSYAVDTNGTYEVGYAYLSNNLAQAMLWSGTANSAVDLESLLPGAIQAQALTIDGQGNIFGVASYSGGSYAVEWSPVPEPSTIVLSVLGAVGFAASALRRRAKRQR
jgi:PEP-CTERM motif